MDRPTEPGPEWARCPQRLGKYEYNWCARHGWRTCDSMSTHTNRYPHDHRADWCSTCDMEAQLRRRYGITPADFAELLASQGGVCAVCSSPDPGGNGSFCVDHDHACCPTHQSCGNCLRGLLCHNCNRGIGSLRDSPRVLVSAANYLLRFAGAS